MSAKRDLGNSILNNPDEVDIIINDNLQKLYWSLNNGAQNYFGEHPEIGWIEVNRDRIEPGKLEIIFKPSKKLKLPSVFSTPIGEIDLENHTYYLRDNYFKKINHLYEDTMQAMKEFGFTVYKKK